MTRHERRALARLHGRNGHGPMALCEPGKHRFAEVVGTVKGEPAVKRVICMGCRRTFQQVMDQSPADLSLYRDFLEQELRAARAAHLRECPRRHDLKAIPVDGCPGCVREAQLVREDQEA